MEVIASQSSTVLPKRVWQDHIMFDLEGRLFDLRRKHSETPEDAVQNGILLGDYNGHEFLMYPSPRDGRPKTRAFLVWNAFWLKHSKAGGVGIPKSVSFGRRELQTLCGRGWGTRTGEETLVAIRQLRDVKLYGRLPHPTDPEAFFITDFNIFQDALTEVVVENGKERPVSIVLTLSDVVHRNMSAMHYARFHPDRVAELLNAPIALLLYKRFFQMGCSLMGESGKPTFQKLERDYADVCRTWIGGLTTYPSLSKASEKLQPHFDRFHDIGIGTLCLAKKTSTRGLKLVFKPSQRFFADYRELFLGQSTFSAGIDASEDYAQIEAPLRLVAYFHTQCGRTPQQYPANEVGFMRKLLSNYRYADIESLIDYTVAVCRKNKNIPDRATVLSKFIEYWEKNRTSHRPAQEAKEQIKRCRLCNHVGNVMLQRSDETVVPYPCPHDESTLRQIEREKAMYRLTSV